MDVTAIELTGAQKTPHVVVTLLRVIANLHVLRGLHLRRGWFPPAIPHVKTQILHLLFHELTFLEFDSEMVSLTNNEKFTEEKDMVLLDIGTQTHVVDVGLHFCTPRNQLLY